MKSVVFAALWLVVSSSALAAPELTLAIDLERAGVAFGEPVRITVIMENRGTSEVTWFEPLFAESTFFPSIRLVNDADGRVYAPWASPFQSMVSQGIQGALIKLGPGEKRVHRHLMVRCFEVLDGERDGGGNQALPPGSYRVRATYEQHDDQVPFNTGGFTCEQRSVPGIFVGTLTSEAVRLTVADPTKPRLVIGRPDENRAVLRVTLTNPTREPYVLSGFPSLTVYSKMYGGGTAHPELTGPGDGPIDQPVAIAVPAGGTNTFELDLRALTFFTLADRKSAGSFGLGELIPDGTVHIGLDILDQDGGGVLSAAGIYTRIAAPESRGLDGLAVVAKLSAGEIGPTDPVTLSATLRNGGDEPVMVSGDFRFPQRILIRIEDAAGQRPSGFAVAHSAEQTLTEMFRPGESMCRIAKGLCFDGDRFERTVGLKSGDIVRLAPGDDLARDFPLAALLADGFLPGEYRVSVGYRNFESGRRLGRAGEDLLGVGVVWSEPVSLVVR